MPRDRFFDIFNYVHPSDPVNKVPGNVSLVLWMLHLFNTRVKRFWVPGAEITIDDVILPSKAHSIHHRNVPRKPHTNG